VGVWYGCCRVLALQHLIMPSWRVGAEQCRIQVLQERGRSQLGRDSNMGEEKSLPKGESLPGTLHDYRSYSNIGIAPCTDTRGNRTEKRKLARS